MRKYVLTGLVLAVLMGGSVFADEAAKQVVLNGEGVGEAIVCEGVDYVPARAVAEACGLNVEWIGETKTVVLTNGGPIYITFSIGENGYTFAKTAPMKYSGAPVLENATTFIPVDAATELLGLEMTEADGTLTFAAPEEETEEPTEEATADETQAEGEEATEEATEEAAEGSVVRTGVISDKSDDEIIFTDSERGDVRLTTGGGVIIKDKDGKMISADELEVGMNVEVVFGPAMTMSLPPLNNPASITVVE